MVPEKIRCLRCERILHCTKFSNKQLNDYLSENFGNSNKKIICKKCNGERPVEYECFMCGETKGTEEFSAAQQRTPDTAKCFKCVEEQVKQQPINEYIYEDPEKAFITPDHSGGRIPEYFSSATSLIDSASTYDDGEQNVNGNGMTALSRQFQHSVSIPNSINGTSEPQSTYASSRHFNIKHGDSRTDVRTQSWHTHSAGPRSTNALSFNSSATERSGASTSHPSGPTGGPMRPMGDEARDREPVVNTWDSGEGEEDEEEDDEDSDDGDDDTVI